MSFWARPVERPLIRAGFVLAFALAVCARLPNVLLHGRLWAEEGNKFYENAATMPWWQAILAPWGGYLNLVATTAPVLARHLVALEYVPWITSGIGLVFQSCPAILLVCARDRWLRPWPAKAAALALIATPPLVEEVWLQTLHSQFHLALCCALILALDIPGRRLAWFGRALLFLAPLCGPIAGTLLPLFLARAVRERSRARLLQACVLGVGLALQLGVFFSPAGRSYAVGPVYLACIVYFKQIVGPLLGRYGAAKVSAALLAQIDARLFPWQAVLVSLGGMAVIAVALFRRREAAVTWLFLAGCVMGLAGYFGAIARDHEMLILGFGARYEFLPQVLGALTVLGLATGGLPDRWVARVLVAWLVLVGVQDRSEMRDGPRWLPEVAAWRLDHKHEIAIWPRGWVLKLDHE